MTVKIDRYEIIEKESGLKFVFNNCVSKFEIVKFVDKDDKPLSLIEFINKYENIDEFNQIECEKERNIIIERENEKINNDFEKKIKQTEVKQRIQHSQELSQSRLQLLRAEDAHLQSLMVDGLIEIIELLLVYQILIIIKDTLKKDKQ